MAGKTWYPIGTLDKPFKGAYDGQGYVIKNLTIPNDDSIHSNVGLFGTVKGSSGKEDNGSISNIYIENATIKGRNNIGTIVGKGENVKLNNIMIKNSTIEAVGDSGALIGHSTNSSIKNCFVDMKKITGSVDENNAWLFKGTASYNQCLIKNASSKKQKGASNTFTEWGKIGDTLIPNKEWGWVALVPDNKVTEQDIKAFGGTLI